MLPRVRVLIRRVDCLSAATSAPIASLTQLKFSKKSRPSRTNRNYQNSDCQRKFSTIQQARNSFEFTMPDLEQAKALIQQEKYLQAESPLERSLEVCESVMGESNPSTISIRRLCAKIYFKQNKYNKLGKVLEKLYKSASKDKHNNRAHWIEAAFDWALFCQQTGRYEQAARALQDVIDMQEGEAELRALAYTRLGINDVLSDQSRDQMALERFDRAAELVKDNSKEVSSLIDGHRGRYYFHTKDYSQASDLFQRAITALEAKSSATTRDLALSELYCNLADLMLVTKDDGKAADSLTRKSVELADKYFDRDALVYRYIDAVVARAQLSTKNYFIAEGLFRRMLDMYEKHSQIIKSDEIEVETIKSYRSLVAKYKRDTEAKQLEERINSIDSPKRSTVFTGSRDFQLYSFALQK